jgi:hypothetical protein
LGRSLAPSSRKQKDKRGSSVTADAADPPGRKCYVSFCPTG